MPNDHAEDLTRIAEFALYNVTAPWRTRKETDMSALFRKLNLGTQDTIHVLKSGTSN